MNDIFFSVHKKRMGNNEYIIFVIDSKVSWDAEINGPEPKYEIFIDFLSDIFFELSFNKNIYTNFKCNILAKKIKDKNHLSRILKRTKSFGQWFFAISGERKNAKWNRLIPYYFELENINYFNLKILENVFIVFFHEIGIKYFEVQSNKLKEKEVIAILNKITKKYNYNIIYENTNGLNKI